MLILPAEIAAERSLHIILNFNWVLALGEEAAEIALGGSSPETLPPLVIKQIIKDGGKWVRESERESAVVSNIWWSAPIATPKPRVY